MVIADTVEDIGQPDLLVPPATSCKSSAAVDLGPRPQSEPVEMGQADPYERVVAVERFPTWGSLKMKGLTSSRFGCLEAIDKNSVVLSK